MDLNKNSKHILELSVVLFAVLVGFWVFISLTNQNANYKLAFGATYGLMALLGAIFGLLNVNKWGGRKSALGLTIIFLSVGLLFAEFGQLVFSYYNIIKSVEVPYPSLADIGFFGSIPFYILGASYLGKSSGVKFGIKKPTAKLLAFLLPVFALYNAYHFFLAQYTVGNSSILKVFLDFGYPIGQAIYVSIAAFIFLTVRGSLGGIMKNRIMLVLLAFLAQFAADFNFLYQSAHSTWTNGGYGDLMYLIAYFMMTISIVYLCSPLKESSKA